MNKDIKNIGIIGAGGWGTAVAFLLAGKGIHVNLWTHETDVIEEINDAHSNFKYLPGVKLPSSIIATDNPSQMKNDELFVMAIPTQFIRRVMNVYAFPIADKLIVNLSKGIEESSFLRVSEILTDSAGISKDQYIVLTGPSHAEEVSRHTPTAVVAAGNSMKNVQLIQKVFSTNRFRVYSSDDITGCEIGGAMKNVIAIASGIVDGLKLGDNAKAALMTRGLAQMTALGTALGANPLTFSGLSGLGDLIVTCNSQHSRNRFVGEQIGKGRRLKHIQREMQSVAEGIATTKSALGLARKIGVEMPITERVYSTLFDNVDPMDALEELMNREFRAEIYE